MKLIDVEQAQVAGRVSRSITGGENRLIAELPSAASELFSAVADRLGIKVPEKIVKKEPVKEEKSAGFVSEQLKGEWFSKSVGRSGRFSVSAYTGGGMFPDVGITYGKGTDEKLDGALRPLESNRQVFKAAISGGYNLFDWLAIGARLGYMSGSGEGRYEDYDCNGSCTPLWAGNLKRTRWAIELGVDVRVAWPFDFWIEPVANVALGFNWMFEDTPESFYPSDLESVVIEIGCTGFFLDAGLGVDIYLYSRWRIGAMFYYLFRSYGNIDGDGVLMRGSRMWTHGGALVFNTGWVF
jgi:hypothetical protein